MASFQKTLNTDVLSVRTIFARGESNANIPAFRVLASDGVGGTSWVTLSTLTYGGAFHRIVTTTGTYTADASNATFSLFDTGNAGLLADPTAPNTAYIYAKAFGQIDISGSNTLYAYNGGTGQITSNVQFIGQNGISIFGDPQTNEIFFDGGKLPFISSAPYAFNQLQVFSNVPSDTLVPSTFSSLIIEAQDPSSVLTLVGMDPVYLTTDYARKQVKIAIPILTTQKISTLLGQQDFLISTSVTKIELSTLSTTYGSVVNLAQLQSGLSTVSTAAGRGLNNYSTSIGSIDVLRRGISTVASNVTQNLLSVSKVYTSDITSLYELIQTDFNVIEGSTIRTPYFWASTMVTLIEAGQTPLPTPTGTVSGLGVTYLPTYSSIYNKFADTQAFGSPSNTYSTYNASLNFGANQLYSTISTPGGPVFSSLVAIQGSFTFYPTGFDPTTTFRVDYSGALTLEINNISYQPDVGIYPKPDRLRESTLNIELPVFTLYTVDYTYIKKNPSDYIRFSNAEGYSEVQTQFIPTHPAYGYNLADTPLHTEVLPSFPLGFSTMNNLGVYQALSSYVLIASTSFTSGCNTTFPISSVGFQSFAFYEAATNRTSNAYQTDLAVSERASIEGRYNPSNAFNYNFASNMPNSAYTLQMVFGRQSDTDILVFSSLTNDYKIYNYTDEVFISSFLLVSSISTQGILFVEGIGSNLNLSSLNQSTILTIHFLQETVSTISTSYGSLVNTAQLSTFSTSLGSLGGQIQSTTTLTLLSLSTLSTTYGSLVNTAQLSTFSTTYGTLLNLAALQTSMSSFSTSLGSVDQLPIIQEGLSSLSSYVLEQISSLSTAYGALGSLGGDSISTFSTSIGEVGSVVPENLSSMSTSYADLKEASTISTLYTNINLLASTINVGLSTYSSIWSTILSDSFSSFSTSYGSIGSSAEISTAKITTSSIETGDLNAVSTTVSSFAIGGYRQPFIQYGWDTISDDIGDDPMRVKNISLQVPYIDTYAIQLAIKNPAIDFANNVFTANIGIENPLGSGLYFSTTSTSFLVIGNTGTEFYWTTFGNIN